MVDASARVPFTLLGGYLGAGKTTIVNHVVQHAAGRRFVVLVNELGAVDVDSRLIADHDGATLSLTNGCVCCAIGDDFVETLELVRSMPVPPDHVLMELSGVAEPARIAPWANTAGFRLDGIVVAADADQIVELAARDYVGGTIAEQLRAADLVLLTKSDLAEDGGVVARSFVASCTNAPIVGVRDGAIELDVLLGIDRTGATPSMEDGPHATYLTTVVELDAPTLGELERIVAELPSDVVRAKGVVACADASVPAEVHVVGRRRVVRLRADLDARGARGIVVISVGG